MSLVFLQAPLLGQGSSYLGSELLFEALNVRLLPILLQKAVIDVICNRAFNSVVLQSDLIQDVLLLVDSGLSIDETDGVVEIEKHQDAYGRREQTPAPLALPLLLIRLACHLREDELALRSFCFRDRD